MSTEAVSVNLPVEADMVEEQTEKKEESDAEAESASKNSDPGNVATPQELLVETIVTEEPLIEVKEGDTAETAETPESKGDEATKEEVMDGNLTEEPTTRLSKR